MTIAHPHSRIPRATGLLALVVALGLSACGSDLDESTSVDESVSQAADEVQDQVTGIDATDAQASANDLADTLRANGLDTFASLVETVDFEQIAGSDQYTLLAPSNDAFLALDSDQTADLLSNPTEVATVIQNHVLDERFMSGDLDTVDTVTTQSGASLAVGQSGGELTIGGARVTRADIEVGDNGPVIHVVDQLLLP